MLVPTALLRIIRINRLFPYSFLPSPLPHTPFNPPIISQTPIFFFPLLSHIPTVEEYPIISRISEISPMLVTTNLVGVPSRSPRVIIPASAFRPGWHCSHITMDYSSFLYIHTALCIPIICLI